MNYESLFSSKGLFKTLSFTLLFLSLSFPLLADEVEIEESALIPLIERFDHGYIDWQESYYYAEVMAPLQKEFRGQPLNRAMQEEMARRTARTLSDSVFLQLAANIRVDAENTVRDLAKDEAQIRLIGNIKGQEEVKTEWIREENGSFLKAVYRVSMGGVDGVVSRLYDQVVQRPHTFNEDQSLSKRDIRESEKALLLVDARGTGARPALFPQIKDESDRVVYDASIQGMEKAIEERVAEYVTTDSLEGGYQALDLKQHSMFGKILYVRAVTYKPANTIYQKRVNINRIYDYGASNNKVIQAQKRKKRKAIRAEKAIGSLKANIIISKEDADRIIKADKKIGFLKKAKVVIITDVFFGGTEGHLLGKDHYWVVLHR